MRTCPHCHKEGISLYHLEYILFVSFIRCDICGKKVKIPQFWEIIIWISISLVLLLLLLGIIWHAEDIYVTFFGGFIVIVGVIAYIFLIPLEPIE